MPQANGNNHSQRLAFLEKAYLEDRKRWQQLTVYIHHNEERSLQILARLEKHNGHIEALLQEIHDRKEGRP